MSSTATDTTKSMSTSPMSACTGAKVLNSTTACCRAQTAWSHAASPAPPRWAAAHPPAAPCGASFASGNAALRISTTARTGSAPPQRPRAGCSGGHDPQTPKSHPVTHSSDSARPCARNHRAIANRSGRNNTKARRSGTMSCVAATCAWIARCNIAHLGHALDRVVVNARCQGEQRPPDDCISHCRHCCCS